MPRNVITLLFIGCLMLGKNSQAAVVDSYYCESSDNNSIPPESLKLSTFADGSASVILGDQSAWIQTPNQTRLSGTEIFYRFELRPKWDSGRESILKIYLSRFSLKLHGSREDRFEGQVVIVKKYNEFQCRKEPLIKFSQ